MDERTAEAAKALLLSNGLRPEPSWFSTLFDWTAHDCTAVRTLSSKLLPQPACKARLHAGLKFCKTAKEGGKLVQYYDSICDTVLVKRSKLFLLTVSVENACWSRSKAIAFLLDMEQQCSEGPPQHAPYA